jgi:type II secretory pathway component PulF
MKTPSLRYSSGSVSEVGGVLSYSTTTMWLLVGVLTGIAGALVMPGGRRPHKRSVGEVGGALTYPIIMMCVGTAIMAFLVAYVVPQVATIFEQQHAALPLATKILIKFSALVTGHWLAMVILSVGSIIGIVGALVTPRGRRLYDYYDHDAKQITAVVEPVMTLVMAAVIVFMMLAVLMPIFQLNQLMQ